jgi:hypothetical protein
VGGRRRGRRARPATPAAQAHAVRQLHGLERALRLERRRDYFRAPGRTAAAEEVSAALRDLEARLAPGGEGGARAVGD